jgi:hypothetical protein
MIAPMRAAFINSVVFVLISADAIHAQGLRPKSIQHASVVAAALASPVTSGATVTLWADVTPDRSIHIYAEGAKDFTPVSLVLTPNAAITAGKPTYPKPDAASAPGSTDAVPAYTKTFRIGLPVTIKPSAKPGDVVMVAGAVNYQACDDRLCYPVAAAPVTWRLQVK